MSSGTSWVSRLRLSVDWAALLVALFVTALIRLGIIGRVPW